MLDEGIAKQGVRGFGGDEPVGGLVQRRGQAPVRQVLAIVRSGDDAQVIEVSNSELAFLRATFARYLPRELRARRSRAITRLWCQS